MTILTQLSDRIKKPSQNPSQKTIKQTTFQPKYVNHQWNILQLRNYDLIKA